MPSSVVRFFTYDDVKHILKIMYVSGTVYNYLKVPVKTYRAFQQSKSKGTYLNKYIKGKFEFEKVDHDNH